MGEFVFILSGSALTVAIAYGVAFVLLGRPVDLRVLAILFAPGLALAIAAVLTAPASTARTIASALAILLVAMGVAVWAVRRPPQTPATRNRVLLLIAAAALALLLGLLDLARL